MNDLANSLTGQAGLLQELLTEAIRPTLEDIGIGLATFELLSAVRGAGSQATQVEVARRLGIAAPTLSETVKSAVSKRLLEQETSPTDGRVKMLRLTRAGARAVERVLQQVEAAERQMLDGIDANELRTTLAVMKQASLNLARSPVAK